MFKNKNDFKEKVNLCCFDNAEIDFMTMGIPTCSSTYCRWMSRDDTVLSEQDMSRNSLTRTLVRNPTLNLVGGKRPKFRQY